MVNTTVSKQRLLAYTEVAIRVKRNGKKHNTVSMRHTALTNILANSKYEH